METSVPTETTETSVVPQGHPIWRTGYPSPRWDALPGGQVIPPHPPSHRLYGNDDPFPKNLPLRDGGDDRPDGGNGGPNGKGAGSDEFAEIRNLLREAEQQGIFQFPSLTAPRMKLAALLHDIGKPITYSTDADGDIHFYDHPQAGVPLAQQIMTRLNASIQDRRVVQLVVAHHMRPGQLAHLDTVTPRAIRRYFVDLGPMGIHVALFSLADHIATLGPQWDEYTKRSDSSWPRHLALVRLLLTRYIRERESILPARLVSPEELMRRLKLEPGPLIGQLLESIAEAQAEGRIHSKEEALWLAEEQIHERK
jgi:poly(A) polymerase